jgi:ADP-ribose pyrophosphatase YjhB (NUDIX family)
VAGAAAGGKNSILSRALRLANGAGEWFAADAFCYNSRMIWTPRTTVAAVIENNGAFLMVEELDSGQLVLNQPAGHLENGESLLEAVRREVEEETAWRFEPSSLLGVYHWQVPHSGITYLRYCFAGSALQALPGQPLDSDIHAALWLSAATIREQRWRHRSPMVQHCLNDYLQGRHYPLEMIHELH